MSSYFDTTKLESQIINVEDRQDPDNQLVIVKGPQCSAPVVLTLPWNVSSMRQLAFELNA